MKKRFLASALAVLALSCNYIKPLQVSADLSEFRTWTQYDSRWGSIPLGGSGCTIASHGCKVTSTAIQLVNSGAVTDSDFTPGTLGNYFNSTGGYDSGGGMSFGCADGYGGSDFCFIASDRKVDRQLSPEDILECQNKGYYCVGGVGYGAYDTGHWMPIFEYDSEANDFHFQEVGAGSLDAGNPSSSQRFFAYHKSIGKIVNAVHVYSCSAKPFSGLNISSSLEEVSAVADSVSEQYSTMVLNTHRLSEYSEDEKDALAILTNKSMNEADYKAFKWNMIISQFSVPYVDSIRSTLTSNSAWNAFFSDAVHYGTNSYIEGNEQAKFDAGSATGIQDYVLKLKEDLTTPIVSKTVTTQQVVTITSGSSGDTIAGNAGNTQSSDGTVEDNIWATFLVSADNPAYKTSDQAKEILTDFSDDPNIGSLAKKSLNSTDTDHAGKKFEDLLSSKNIGPGITGSTVYEYAGGDIDSYDGSGPLPTITDSFRSAMVSDMRSALGSDYGGHANTGMGYRTFWQASWIDSGANTVKGYWNRTLGMFSEHCAGVATDFSISLGASDFTGNGNKLRSYGSAASKEFSWLADNAHKYGFIWRFKIDGSEKSAKGYSTKTVYESWHWRFVGVYHATQFWKKCSSDGVTGYDVNDDYIWEDYFAENIKGKSKYPQTAYEGIHNFLKTDKGVPMTYSQYQAALTGDTNLSLNQSSTNSLGQEVSSVDVDQTSTVLEPSSMLQTYNMMMSDNGNYSNLYNEKGDMATVKDLFTNKVLYLKDTIAVAGSKFVDVDKQEASNVETLHIDSEEELAEREENQSIDDTLALENVGSKTLIGDLWSSLSEYGSYVNGSVQSVWDSVSEGAYTEVVSVPVYINSDVTLAYNQIFTANACRLLGIPTYTAFLEKFGSTDIVMDATGNICLGVSHTVVYPAFANTIFTTLPNVDQDTIGVVYNTDYKGALVDLGQNSTTPDRINFVDLLENNATEASDVFNHGFKKLLLKDDWTNTYEMVLDSSTTPSVFPAIVRIDSENTPLVNKILLSEYVKNPLPGDTSFSLYTSLDAFNQKYKEIDLEKYNSEYNKISRDSLFDNSLFISDSYSEQGGVKTSGRAKVLFGSNILDTYRRKLLKDNNVITSGGIALNWATEYTKLDSHFKFVTTNVDRDLSIEGTPIYFFKENKFNSYPTGYSELSSLPVYRNVFLPSELYPALVESSMSQPLLGSTNKFDYCGYVEALNPVSPVLEKYPLEDIVYISYIWNEEYFNKMLMDKLQVTKNNLSEKVYVNSVINLTNICQDSNNNRIVFTRSSEFSDILSKTETVHGYYLRSNTNVYAVDYNLAYTMLAINKNSYGVNLERMRKDLENDLDTSLGILDRMWELSTETGKSLLYMALTLIQILHNWINTVGLGNPFNSIQLLTFISGKQYIVATVFSLVVLLGLVVSTLAMIRMKVKIGDLIAVNIKLTLLAFVPILCTFLILGIVNNMSVIALKEISATSVLNSLEHSKLKGSSTKTDSAFYTFIPDEDRGFYGYTVRMPGHDEPVKLYELYNNVSLQSWVDDTDNPMPWYDHRTFIPVHANLYGESVFYYFYDYLMYQYLGYGYRQQSSGIAASAAKYEIPDFNEGSTSEFSSNKTTLATYKNSVSLYNAEFMGAKNNVKSMYEDDTYTLTTYKDNPYVNDLLGLSNLFNMTISDDRFYYGPSYYYYSDDYDVRSWAKDTAAKFYEQDHFNSYGKGEAERVYPLALILTGVQGDAFIDVQAFAPRTFALSETVTFSPQFMDNYFSDVYDLTPMQTLDGHLLNVDLRRDYYKYEDDMDPRCKIAFSEMTRIPWRVYASEGLLLNHLKGTSKYKVSPLEEKLININEDFYNFTQSVNMQDVTDDTMIFSLALEATFLFNSELDNTFDKVLEPKSLDPSGTSSDTIMRAIYLNDFKLTGHNFTYSLYETYNDNLLIVLIVLLEEVFLFLVSLCKSVLFILLILSSLRFVISVFKYPSEIRDMLKGLFKQIVLVLFSHGFTMFILVISFRILRSNVYGIAAFVVALTSVLIFTVFTQWSISQIISMLLSFKDFGNKYISRHLDELKDSLNISVNGAAVSLANISNTLIHKSPMSSGEVDNKITRDMLMERDISINDRAVERRMKNG